MHHEPVFLNEVDSSDISKKHGRYLPHWSIENGIYHVRFRLCDSLSRSQRDMLLTEKEALLDRLHNHGDSLTPLDKKRLLKLHTEKVENMLDQGYGVCWLKQEPIAKIVAESLHFFNSQRYNLFSWCVMPNHVHAVVQPIEPHILPAILRSWKSFTAHQANIVLDRCGQFWLPENFDRLIRSQDNLESTIQYVLKNPEKAGLLDWPWFG